MKKIIILLSVVLLSSLFVSAQEKKQTIAERAGVKAVKSKVYKANPDDVKSIDSIIKATYDVISGGVGVKRDWDRFNSLFHPSARLIPTGKNRQTGVFGAFSMKPEGYVERSGNFLIANGFTEKEIARKTEVYGNIAHVFSSYEGTFTQNGAKQTIRGINSFQLVNDGKRWWVLTIFWQGESEDNPIPAKYLKSEK